MSTQASNETQVNGAVCDISPGSALIVKSLYLETITHYPSIFSIDHIYIIKSMFMVKAIGLQRVKRGSGWGGGVWYSLFIKNLAYYSPL